MYLSPTKDKLTGKYVILENLFTDKHLADLYESSYLADEKNTIFTFMMFGPFKSKDNFKIWLASQEALTDRIIYSVIVNESGHMSECFPLLMRALVVLRLEASGMEK